MSDSEVASNAALSMDRGVPIGNSLGNDNRRALHVRSSAGQLVTESFDKITASYPDAVTEVFTYTKSAVTVATVTVVYTTSAKTLINTVTKT